MRARKSESGKRYLDRVVALSLPLTVVLSLSISLAQVAFAQDEAPAADSTDATFPGKAGKPSKSKKSPYKRSRLTNDESEAKADKRKLLLAQYEDKAVDLDFEANGGANGIAIGNSSIVTTTLVKVGEKRQIVFKPLKEGTTTVSVRDVDGTLRLIFNVVVGKSNLSRQAGEIRELIRDVDGVEVRIVGQKVVVEGQVLVPADYGRVAMVLEDPSYRASVFNLVTISPLAMQVLAKRIQDDVNTFAPNVKTRLVNGVILMEGTVDTQDQARRAEKVAGYYLPEFRAGGLIERSGDPNFQRAVNRKLVDASFIVINPPAPKKQEKLVRVTIHFVELKKDYTKLFAFTWNPGFTANPTVTIGQNGQGAASAESNGFAAAIGNLIPRLNHAQDAGYARVLRTGTVVVRSGQPAKMEDTEQIPYTAPGSNGGPATTAFQSIGFSVAVTPQILGQSEDIAMEIDTEQSTPSANNGGSERHRVNTRVYVKSNESAAVAGVSKSNVKTQFNRNPAAAGSFEQGTQPIFNLTRSKNYTKSRGQFVFFITPQIIDSASEGTEDLKKNFRVKVK